MGSPSSLHSSARLLTLALISVGAGFAFLLTVPSYAGLLDTVRSLTAQVGVAVGVMPNDINTLADELHQKQIALDVREQAIAERESQVNKQVVDDPFARYAVVLTTCLIVLIIANIWLDRREKRPTDNPGQTAVQ